MDSNNHAKRLKNTALVCNNFWVLMFQILLKGYTNLSPFYRISYQYRLVRYSGFLKDQLGYHCSEWTVQN